MSRAQPHFDPRAKLAVALTVVLASFLIGSIRGQLLLFGSFLLIVAAVREVPVRRWLKTLRPLGLLVAVLLVLNTLFYASGPAVFAVPIGPVSLSVTEGGFLRAVFIATRLVVIASAGAWFALATEPERFEAALVTLGVPWSFAFLLSLTAGLVPRMQERFRVIEESQRSRGLDLSGGPIAKIRARIPMLVPFMAATIRSGYALSTALSARGFDEPGPRTSITTVEHGPADLGLYLLAVGLLAGGLLL
jgi:energy-coupling factor transport system permease protein